ncbi:DNA ligase 1-like isoform X2 [Macrobrachium rosenbergii]|uniref:DNA ligase 1-like isoform X2 n=1 Tax=Macrobrachium rosenbergii TaxID=79674 RepID=UPI0034D71341
MRRTRSESTFLLVSVLTSFVIPYYKVLIYKPKSLMGRRIKKNEGSVMRAEVQRYKDRERRQGIYAHGCTSGTVKRDFGLSKESQARAEANLSRILELASNSNGDNPPKHASSSSLKDEYGDRVNERSQNLKESPMKNNEKSLVEDKSGSLKKETIGSKESESTSSEKKTEEDEREEILKQLADAVASGIDSKTRLIGSSSSKRGRLKETFAALMSLPNESTKTGNYGVSTKLQKIKQLRASEQKVKQWSEKHFSSSQPNEALRTPVLQEVLQIPVENSSGVQGKKGVGISQSLDSTKCNLATKRKRKSACVLATSPTVSSVPCPGTTIINPRALLLRYEEKLERSRTSASVSSSTTHGFNREKVCGSDVRDLPCKISENKKLNCGNKNRKSKSSEKGDFKVDKTSDSKVHNIGRSQQELDTAACSSKCIKSVIVNPLDYLKIYEKQAGNDYRQLHESNMNTKFGTSTLELGRTYKNINRHMQIVPVPFRSVNGLEVGSVDVTSGTRGLFNSDNVSHEKKVRSEVRASDNQIIGSCHKAPRYGEELLKRIDSDSLTVPYETGHQISGNVYGAPLSEHLEEPGSTLLPAVKCCVDKVDMSTGKCFLSCKNIMPLEKKNKSCSPVLDVIEEAVLNDFVFPKYVEKDPDSLRITSNLKSMKEFGEHNYITTRK